MSITIVGENHKVDHFPRNGYMLHLHASQYAREIKLPTGWDWELGKKGTERSRFETEDEKRIEVAIGIGRGYKAQGERTNPGRHGAGTIARH
jgi:hypothetical protein